MTGARRRYTEPVTPPEAVDIERVRAATGWITYEPISCPSCGREMQAAGLTAQPKQLVLAWKCECGDRRVTTELR